MTRAATDGSLADAYDPMSAEVKQDPEATGPRCAQSNRYTTSRCRPKWPT